MDTAGRQEERTHHQDTRGYMGKQGRKRHLNLDINPKTVFPFATDSHMFANTSHFHSLNSEFAADIFCGYGDNTETSDYFLWSA